jgi:hypothetical protein
VLLYGCNSIVALIAWVITLITGRLPAPLHQAYSAVLRYQIRFYSYYWMLTPTYPWQLFGDAPGTAAFAPPAGPPAGTEAPTETTEFGQPATPATSAWDTPADPNAAGYGTPPSADVGASAGYATFESVYGTPSGYAGAQPTAQTVTWPLVLSRSAKNLLIVFIALGLISFVTLEVVNIVRLNRSVNATNTNLAISQWNSTDSTLNTKMEAWTTAENNCGQNLTCVTKGDAQAASYMSDFASQVKAISMPSGAASAAARAVADATKSAADFTTLSKSTSVAQYESAVTSTGLEKDVDAVQTDIGDVATAFNNS